MCGIAGIWSPGGPDNNNFDVEPMTRILAHRGPDDRGVLVRDRIGLAHSRLAIIDPAGGRQPMCNEDGTLWLTFNGEIFNYVELRRTLIDLGHRFATLSDTEVILHAYEEFGSDCVHHFNGQWAFALWDATRGRLFLSRDRLGIRPLFYAQVERTFLFGSEVKAILAHGLIRPRMDRRALDQILTFWCSVPPRTAFEGVNELPPGHNLVVDENVVAVRRYWRLDFAGGEQDAAVDGTTDRLAELLYDATRLRLRSDVPVGVYLSGGLDSSVVAALARKASGDDPTTFSVTFDDPEFDETAFQRETVAFLRSVHSDLRCSPSDICQVFPDVVWHAETPILRSAPAPLHLLSSLVHSNDFKVVLSGEGADEIFGGYDIFKEAKIRRFWAAMPDSKCRPLLLRRLYPYLPNLQSQSTEYLKATFRVEPEDLDNPYFSHLPRWSLTEKLKLFYSEQIRSELEGYRALDDLASYLESGLPDGDAFSRAQYLEMAILLPGYILSSQGDRMSMAHSVEGRYPFLDHRVVECAVRLHPNDKMKVLEEKFLLKKAASGLVPQSVIQRTKQPYRAPDSVCFFDDGRARSEYVRTLMSREKIAEAGLFDPGAVSHLVEKARRGRTMSVRDNMAVVGILSAQLVFDQFVCGFDSRVSTDAHRDGDHVA